MPKLQISLPDAPELTKELTEGIITIGRLEDNTVEISDPSVSSHHAQLALSGEDYLLKDLDSTNGTRVNGEPVAEAYLKNGDKVRFGNIEAIYTSESSGREGLQMPPEEEAVVATPAAASSPPSDFGNASPFRTKHKRKNPVGRGIMGFAVFSMLVFMVAVVMILTLRPPSP